MARIRSKHNNLLNYFICDRRDLSPAYVRGCEKFLKKNKKKLKVSSSGGPAHKSPSALEHINLKEKYASLEPDPSARKQEIC